MSYIFGVMIGSLMTAFVVMDGDKHEGFKFLTGIGLLMVLGLSIVAKYHGID